MKKPSSWIGLIIVLILWMTLHLTISQLLIPNPLDTIVTMIQNIINGNLLIHTFFSLYRLFIAVGFSLITGVFSGIALGMNPKIEKVFAPVIYVLFPVPKAALLPIVFLLFGLGDLAKIALIFLILYFQIALAVYDGVKDLDKDYFLSAKTLRLDRKQLYFHIVIPAMLPSLLSALKTSVGIGIAVLFFAETYATDKGLGYYIMTHWSLLNFREMYAGILLLGIIGFVIFKAIDKLKDLCLRWM